MNRQTGLEQRGYRSEVDAADYMGLAPSTMRAWRVRGRGPRYYKIGGRVFYKQDDLDAWIEAQVHCSTSEAGSYDRRARSAAPSPANAA